MSLGKKAQIGLNGTAVEAVGSLPDLIDLAVSRHIVAIDGEGYDHADVARLAKLGKATHLMGIERSEDDVATGSGRIGCEFLDIVVNRDIPGMHVDAEACALQAVAGHEEAPVILGHAAPVTVDVVERQHQAHMDDILAALLLGVRLGRGRRRVGHRHGRRPGNEEAVALLQRIASRLHVGICGPQLVFREAVFLGDAIDSVFLLHLVDVTPLGHLSRHGQPETAYDKEQECSA